MIARTFDVGGVAVALVGRAEDDLKPLSAVLAGFPETAAPPRWRVLLLPRPPLSFAASRATARDGQLPEGTPIRAAWGPKGRQLLVDGRLGIRVNTARRLIVCRLGEGAELLYGSASMSLIDAILEAEGQHLVHAALLALPPALGDGALLLIGESGAGKSSTALALARGGWALAGDDAAVLSAEGAGVAAWGFPRALKVHPFTAGLLPWLQGLVPPDAADEVPVETGALAGLVAQVEGLRRLPIRAIAFLEQRGEAHRLVHLGASEAALRLTAGQLFAPEGRLTRAVAEQFQLMTRLAATARWRVACSLGPDLQGLPDWLAAQVSR